MRSLFWLIHKDFRIEFRKKVASLLVLSNAVILAVVISAGIYAAYLPPNIVEKLYPIALWLVLIFALGTFFSTCFDQDLTDHAIEGVILTGVPYSIIYLSKVITAIIVAFATYLLSALWLAVFMNIADLSAFIVLTLLNTPSLIGLCALSTLLMGVSSASRLKGSVLPLLQIPFSLPLILISFELSLSYIQPADAATLLRLSGLILVIDVIYLAAGAALFKHVLNG